MLKLRFLKMRANLKKVRIDSAFEALELVLKYKRENPQEFEEIFSALARFSQKCKNDSKIDE